jgi:hypothetical protein
MVSWAENRARAEHHTRIAAVANPPKPLIMLLQSTFVSKCPVSTCLEVQVARAKRHTPVKTGECFQSKCLSGYAE